MNNAGDEGALPSSGEFRKESVLTPVSYTHLTLPTTSRV